MKVKSSLNFSTKTELNGLVNSLTSLFADSNIPTWKIVRCHSSGLEGMTTYSIASPSSAAATARLVTKIGKGGTLERVIRAQYYSKRLSRNFSFIVSVFRIQILARPLFLWVIWIYQTEGGSRWLRKGLLLVSREPFRSCGYGKDPLTLGTQIDCTDGVLATGLAPIQENRLTTCSRISLSQKTS